MSLYDINYWAGAGTQYYKNDVVYGGASYPYFFYATVDHVATDVGNGILTDWQTNGYWNGVNPGNYMPVFFWLPSYGLNVNITPRVKTVKFGDGYEQRTPDGININLIQIDYSFENRKLAETNAILHFLNQRNGYQTFLHTALAPYNVQKKMVCRTFNHVQTFIDAFSIKARFEEVTV